MDLVLVRGTIVEIVKHARYVRTGMADNDHDALGCRARQRITAVFGRIGAGLIHGVRIDGTVDYAAGAVLKIGMNLNGWDEELDCR